MRTLADIEHGVRKASAGTYAMLENKLAWVPGSIDTILAGGEPQELVVHIAPRPPQRPAQGHSPDQATPVARLHRGVVAGVTPPHHRPPHHTHDTWDDWDGLDPHGDWPEQG